MIIKLLTFKLFSWALCCSVSPVASQEAAASPASAAAGLGQAQVPGKLSVAQKPQPKLRILLAFPKGSMAARGMWSLGTSGSDQLQAAASL